MAEEAIQRSKVESDGHAGGHHLTSESLKDTLISIIIAFAMAFVFRGFVVEAFVIPTGSMAPTLMGGHMRFRDPASGWEWTLGPWYVPRGVDLNSGVYAAEQGPVATRDPMGGALKVHDKVRLRSGDRILVLKYLYALMEPARFDVIVFKDPTQPQRNYIKRLIGLPGEEIALVDGDVFVRTSGTPAGEEGKGLWEQGGWKIARKPMIQQRAVWQTVFDSEFAPTPLPAWWKGPWAGYPAERWGPGTGARTYSFDGNSAAELVFDQNRERFNDPNPEGRRADTWAIDDRYDYDEGNTIRNRPPYPYPHLRFPVSDVRLRAGVEARGPGLKVTAEIQARRQEFAAEVSGNMVTLKRRALAGESGIKTAWETLGTATVDDGLAPGRVVNIELWHVDQAVRVLIDGATVLSHEYDWSPAERIARATGRSLAEVTRGQRADGANFLANPGLYDRPQAKWTLSGAPAQMHRVGLDRDLHYQPATYQSDQDRGPALATSPVSPLRLGKDQFFPCGDNSPSSHDGRLWGEHDAWVRRDYERVQGIVPRDLMMGRAFFVYWPSLLYGKKPLPVPDFGRMRFIW